MDFPNHDCLIFFFLLLQYMEHGSLYDILHNETMVIEGELLLPLLRDITQGVNFLHQSNPSVIHGDLKSANILVDNRLVSFCHQV